MNPTNLCCPSDINAFVQTDYRPNKALYENVNNNNAFRLYLQQNAEKIRANNLALYVNQMYCACEERSPSCIPRFQYSKHY